MDGQACLITGASRGIGLACAREFAALGADVMMIARDDAHLEQMRAELSEEFPEREILAFGADVVQREQRLEVFDWIADVGLPLSLLVNNVGTNIRKPTLEYEEDEVRTIIETNVVSAFEMCRLAYPHLTEHANAAIVNVGSVSGLTHVRTGSPYGMTKAALTQLTRNLACEWAADGIRVNAIAPGRVRTAQTEAIFADPVKHAGIVESIPLGRSSVPADLDGAVLLLTSDAGAYITGQTLSVDGGWNLGQVGA
jgi:tropinone reductase I